ncbi:two-partner secretion domain-containing protein [Vibrio sp. SCSIO 43137]|uniref:two-partner secretion domain-containing protein n=1 Tax=Vibrio sp. SCSIO 43137 TaxID=3021011 RepID=UPI00230716DD|nr:hemagglutinin repeat-containing protein [Vibrio sp. SCSIO 43137]WCE32067.1 hemagglutinin repeat-containing protein [Vibrio sp. SCSIO 43137]
MKRHPSFHSDLAAKPVARWQRGLVYLLCGLINVQPVLANVVVSGGNTTVTNAVNGVEVVNIATPNGKGLSHNQYQQFDVDSSGLILNNSTEHLGVSQLGGILQNNPNLTGGAASVILNEVTGANASQLQGYTEVFGSQANVILANPYGITCSGCGFINTPRVTLSTGAPDITNGEVTSFDVAEGAVTIEGLGLDATRQSYFDIISRTAELNAAINAKELTVITGQNNVRYQTNQVTEKAATVGDKPQLAIDSSSLGGMYAGRITLIATEDGVGVNVGNLAATQGKLVLTADGKIQLADASSSSDITISSSDTVALTGKQFAENSLSVSADNISATNGTLASEKEVSLNASNDVQLTSSTIASGVDRDGNRLTGGDIKLTADHTQLTDSRINAVDTLTSQSANITLDSDSEINSKTVSLNNLTQLSNDGTVSVSDTFTLSGEIIAVTGAGRINAENANVQANQANLATTLNSGTLDLRTTGQLDIADTAALTSQQGMTIHSDTLNQNGQLTAQGDASLTVNTLTQTGKTEAANLTVNAETFSQQGVLQANEALTITSKQLTLAGRSSAAHNAGITTDRLTLDGELQSGRKLSVTARDAVTTGTAANMLATETLTLNADSLDNHGRIQSDQTLSLTTQEQLTNQSTGTLETQGALTISAGELRSEGTMLSEQDVSLTAANSSITLGTNSATRTNGAMSLTTDNLNQAGQVSAGTSIASTANHIELTGGSFKAGEDIRFNADTLELNSQLTASRDIVLDTKSSLTTANNIVAGRNLSLTSQSLDNRAELSSSGNTNITLTGNLTNQTTGLISGSNTTLSANGVTNHGRLQALTDLGLTAASLDNRGSVVALQDATLTLSGDVTNHGLLYAGNHANLYSNALTNFSDIVVGKNLLIARNAAKQRSSRMTNSSGTIESLGGDIGIYADTVENKAVGDIVELISSKDISASYPELSTLEHTEHRLRFNYREEDYDDSRGHYGGTRTYFTLLSPESFSVEVKKDVLKGKSDVKISTIKARENLGIDSNTVTNNASLIAADTVSISANTLTNQGYDLKTYSTYYDYSLWSTHKFSREYQNFRNSHGRAYQRINVRKVETSSGKSLNASITATNNLNLNVTNKVNNATIRANAGPVTLSKGSTQAQNTQSASGNTNIAVTSAAINLPGSNTVVFPAYQLPDSPHGLFIYSPDPKGNYLIETSPALTNIGTYLGSEYFQNKLGFNPNRDVTFLGDAFYDTRVVTQAIFEQTGRRYLNDSVGSDLSQMQQLMDAAAQQQSALNLSAGIALTPEQVANLTQDILWYEEIEVNGRKVLAPKLYLAKATKQNMVGGARLAGNNTTINAGDFDNSGTVAATDKLNIVSQQGIDNIGGSLTAQGDTTLLAKQDITNISGTIRGDKVDITSTEGSVVNKTRVQQIHAAGTGQLTQDAAATGITHTFTEKGAKSSITATSGFTITAGKDIVNQAAELKSGGDMRLAAGGDVRFEAAKEVSFDKSSYGREVNRNVKHLGSEVTSNGAISVSAGKDIQLTAGTIAANDELSLNAGNSVTINSGLNQNYSHKNRGNVTTTNHSKTHQGSQLSGDKVTINAGENITLSGSKLKAKGDAELTAKGDVDILAVNNSQYSYYKKKTKKSFGRSKTTIIESLHETVQGSEVDAGGNLTITAQKHTGVQQAGGDSDISLVGSALKADGKATLTADGDILLTAQQYREYARKETIKKGFGGLSGRQKGSVKDATLLDSGYLITSGNTRINSGKDIGIVASEVVSDGEVNLTAVDDVLINAGEVLKLSQQWDKKTRFLSGGNLFEMESKREGEQSSTAQASAVRSQGNLTVDAGSVSVVGSELDAQGSINLSADTGSIDIAAAKESRQSYYDHEKLTIGLGDTSKLVSVKDGKLKITLGKATYDKVDEKTQTGTHKGSQLNATENIAVNAESDISVTGSALAADTDGNNSGDITLTAKDNIRITEAKNTKSTQRKEVHGKAEVSLVVQHQAAEVAKAAQALQEATSNLKKAKSDYKQYQKQLDSLEDTLDTLKQEYAERKPGVAYEDIEELNDLIAEVKSDEGWYQTGIALAAADVASKSTQLVQQTAAAAKSTGTYGFNAGLQFDMDATKTSSDSQQTSSVASTLSGENVHIRAGNEQGKEVKVQGSSIKANDILSVEGNEINLLASVDTQNQKNDSESGSVSASMTVYGGSSGINLNASLSRNQSKSSSTTHTNSVLNGENIRIVSAQDTNVKGANVDAGDSLTVNVGNDLNVASVQDRHSASHKGMGISGGLSLSGGEVPQDNAGRKGGVIDNFDGNAGDLTGASGGLNASNGRSRSKETVLSTLTSGNTADITVANNTDIKGALVATVDGEGKDQGNLNLTTDTLTYVDLTNTDYNQSRSMGVNTSVGVNGGKIDATNNSTSLQYKNTSGYNKSKTLATVGKGNLTIKDSENSDDTSSLNRDTEHTEKDLFTVDRKQGDIDVTVDHRLLTEEGRKAIAKDVETTHEAGQDVYRAAETYVNSDDMDLFDFGKSVSDNRKVTELKNELLSSQEGLDLLNDLKSTDPDKVLAAQAEISKLAQKKYGLEPEKVNFYNADKTTSVAMQDNDVRDVKGGVVTDDDHELHGEVNVDVSDATTKTDLLNTLGHETYESITENTTGEQTAAQEDLAKSFGNQLEDRVNQAAGGDLDSTVDNNWNSSLVNSSTAQLGTERVNKVGDANVDHMLGAIALPAQNAALAGGAGASGNKTVVTTKEVEEILNKPLEGVNKLLDGAEQTWDRLIGADGQADMIDHHADKLSTLETEIKLAQAEGDIERVNELNARIDEALYILSKQPYDVISGVQEKLTNEGTIASTGGQPIPDPLPMPSGSEIKKPEAVVLVTPEADKLDSTTVTPASGEQVLVKTETPDQTGESGPNVYYSEGNGYGSPKGIKLDYDTESKSWTTSAGLIYGQGSKHGNRIEHVLDHADPNPNKKKHSVFNVDRNEVLGLIDEAWSKKGTPVANDPGAYIIPMGREVGTEGETNIKVVVRPGTNEVITAFPLK